MTKDRKESNRKYYQEHKKEILLKKDQYYNEHREEILKKAKVKFANRSNNKIKEDNEKLKNYYQKNKKELQLNGKQKYIEHREEILKKASIKNANKPNYWRVRDSLEYFKRCVKKRYILAGSPNIEKYTLKILKDEASDKLFLDINYLYERFKDNCKYNLYYGNVEILKIFCPLMLLKVFRNQKFTKKEKEMFDYFENFKNTTGKTIFYINLPIEYNPKDEDNKKKMQLYLKIYNLTADFLKKRKRIDLNS